MRRIIVTFHEAGSGVGALVVIIFIIALFGSCSDSKSSDTAKNTSYDSEDYAYEETYDSECDEDYDYDGEYACCDYEYGDDYYEEEPCDLADLCFYSGRLTEENELDDCFGTTHYDVVYNGWSYLYSNYNSDPESISNRYYLGGEYSSLSFNAFSTSGDIDICGTISVFVSYSDTVADEALLYSIDMYGGQIPENVYLDLTGVTFLRISVTTFDCQDLWHYNECHVGIGDFELN